MDSKFYCEVCNYKTDYNSKYQLHIKTEKHKRSGKKKEYLCKSCNYKTTISLWNLKMHVSANHLTKEEREKSKYYCKDCDSIFFSPLYYNNHLKSILHKTNTEKSNNNTDPILSSLDKKLLLMKEQIKKELYNEILELLNNN